MIDNYEKILNKIAQFSGIEKEEVQRRVEAKRAKLSGLISREGALQVIAAELGVNFDNEKFKIDELLPGMRKVNLIGKIIRLFPVRGFTTKNGDEGKVLNFILADETSNIKVVLWDTHHISFFEEGKIKEGDSIEIKEGSIRQGEIHLGSFSKLEKSTEIFENVKEKKAISEKSISNFGVNESVSTRAFVVQAFEPRFFEVCPECKKKLENREGKHFCSVHGGVLPEKRALINIVLDDGSEIIRAVIFHDNIHKLGFNNLNNLELTMQEKENLIGKEFIFSGDVRINKFFNNPEFIINRIEEVDLDKLILQLEQNAK
jgi:replication factor A1